MRTSLIISTALLLLATAFTCEDNTIDIDEFPEYVTEPAATSIHWYTLEEALVAQEASPKPILIDVYTDWCGWCKVMDTKTFAEAEVIDFMNDHFYAVKFDAEQKERVEMNGSTYDYIARGKRGINELALELLDGRPSYPAFVILDADQERLGYFRGYKVADAFISAVEEELVESGSLEVGR